MIASPHFNGWKSLRRSRKSTERILIEQTIRSLRDLGARSLQTDNATFVQYRNLHLASDGKITDLSQAPAVILPKTGSTEYLWLLQQRGAFTPFDPTELADETELID